MEQPTRRTGACHQCNGPIPSSRPPQARYCSQRCKNRACYERSGRQRVRIPLCRHCGESIPLERDAQALYCSDLCKWRRAGQARRGDRGPRPCRWCGEQFTPRANERPHVEYCSDRCRNKRNAVENAEQRAIVKANWRHIRRAQLVGQNITAAQWLELAERHDGRCAYCGVSPDVLTQDHVVPVARGGAHSIENIVPACQPCNSSKGDKLLDEWKLTPGYVRRMARCNS